jgi:hypothetical protein
MPWLKRIEVVLVMCLAGIVAVERIAEAIDRVTPDEPATAPSPGPPRPTNAIGATAGDYAVCSPVSLYARIYMK